MKQLILFALFFWALHTMAQTAKPIVNLTAHWQKNDSFQYKIKKHFKYLANGKMQRNDSINYTATLKVASIDDNIIHLQWRSNANLSNYLFSIGVPERILKLVNDRKTPIVKYMTDGTGSFNGVENWKEIAESMSSLIKDIIKKMEAENKKENGLTIGYLKQYEVTFKTQKGVDNLLMKEITLMHYMYGKSYTLGQNFKYDDALPNILGGEPIKADANTLLEKIDSSRNQCTLLHTLQLKPADTKQVIMTLYKKMKLKDEDIAQAMKKSSMAITDANEYIFDYKKGIPVSIKNERSADVEVKMFNTFRIEQVSLERIN